jgi:hypothetical protein
VILTKTDSPKHSQAFARYLQLNTIDLETVGSLAKAVLGHNTDTPLEKPIS